ncbi:MAG: YARHG domain-containing protein [Ignavibacteria bacterium]
MKSNFRKFLFLFLLTRLLFAQSEFNVRLYNPDKILERVEITKLLPVERELLQAEILANYGYIFDDTLLQRYFLKQIWYEAKTKRFPHLSEIDSINYFLLNEYNQKNERTIWENVKRFRPVLDDIQKAYFSYCFENSNYKSIAKRKFRLKPFNYCLRQVYYIPRLELPVGVWDFERFFSEEDFDIKEYAFFKWANDVRGILYRAFFSKDGRLLQLDEVGVDPGLNLGKVVTENYLDTLGRIFVHYNLDCRDGDFQKMARILDYDGDKIKKEILLLEDQEYLYLQITTKDFFIETGLRKKK